MVLSQSAEQRCREVEAVDAASVSRLVGGVCRFRARTPRDAQLLLLVRVDCNDVVVVMVIVL